MIQFLPVYALKATCNWASFWVPHHFGCMKKILNRRLIWTWTQSDLRLVCSLKRGAQGHVGHSRSMT